MIMHQSQTVISTNPHVNHLSLEEPHFICKGHEFDNLTSDLVCPPEKGYYIVQDDYVAASKASANPETMA
jgi:hypothetical protein